MSLRVAVVGATGAVGTVMLEKLRESALPIGELGISVVADEAMGKVSIVGA